MCFNDYQKLIDNGDRIGNFLEHLHHQNINFLVLGRGMSNLLEMLYIDMMFCMRNHIYFFPRLSSNCSYGTFINFMDTIIAEGLGLA